MAFWNLKKEVDSHPEPSWSEEELRLLIKLEQSISNLVQTNKELTKAVNNVAREFKRAK